MTAAISRRSSTTIVIGTGACVHKYDRECPRRDRRPADAHHIYIGPDDGVYLAGRDAHQVLKHTPDE